MGEGADANTYEREIREVCKIFEEVTGAEANPKREGQAVMHWIRHGWKLYDFRLLIEYQFRDEEASAFFKKPGRMNLRNFFNSSRDILIDIHADLMAAEKIKKRKEAGDEHAPVRERKMLMRCGSQVHKHEYDKHLDLCFEKRGGCFA